MANPNPNDNFTYTGLLYQGLNASGSSSSPPTNPSPNQFSGYQPIQSPFEYNANLYQQFTQNQAQFQQFQQQQQAFLQFQQQQTQQQQTQQQQHQQQTQQTQPVQETQQKSQQEKRKGKVIKGRFEGVPVVCNKKNWTANEEAWLCECWVDTSEDPKHGNSQKKDSYWGKIRAKFCNNAHGWERGANQLTSKWRNINQYCGQFNAIYNEQIRAWGSGCDDRIMMDRALTEYELINKKPFTMKESWNVLKDKPKWLQQPGVGGNVSRQLFDEDEDAAIDLEADENELFGTDRIPRPAGRLSTRPPKVQKSQSSSDAATSSRSAGSRLEIAVENIADIKVKTSAERLETVREIRQAEKMRAAIESMRFLKETTDGYSKKDAAKLKKLQKRIRKQVDELLVIDDEEDEGEDDDEDEE